MLTGFRYDTVQDVDALWEDDAAAEWERLNAPDPYEDQMKTAAKSLKSAIALIDLGNDAVYQAISDLDDTPMADKVQSIGEEIESLVSELRKMQINYERGLRE